MTDEPLVSFDDAINWILNILATLGAVAAVLMVCAFWSYWL